MGSSSLMELTDERSMGPTGPAVEGRVTGRDASERLALIAAPEAGLSAAAVGGRDEERPT